jgi:hypothetical protein
MRKKWPVFACEIYNMENGAMLSRSRVVVALMITVACSASPAKVTRPWRVELLTSGGISGRGVGNVTLTSDGKLEVTTISRKACTFEVTTEELDAIEQLLAESRPKRWGSYVPENRCCDRVEYTLSYDEDTALWIDAGLPLPEDVLRLSRAMAELRRKYTAECMNE